jgi:hypothetical protein
MTTVLFRVNIHTQCTMKRLNTDFTQTVTKRAILGQTKTQASTSNLSMTVV